MAYKVTYEVEIVRGPFQGEPILRKAFRAVFNFETEVAEVDRVLVEQKLRIGTENSESPNLHTYLIAAEKLRYFKLLADSPEYALNFGNEKVSLRVDIPAPKGFWHKKPVLALYIKGDARQNIPLEELLDLDGINKFILRGLINTKPASPDFFQQQNP